MSEGRDRASPLPSRSKDSAGCNGEATRMDRTSRIARRWAGRSLAAFAIICVLPLGAASASAPAPTAASTCSPAPAAPGQAATFTSTSTGAPWQAWDLDNDGRYDDGFGTSATRTFPASGTYTVRLLAVSASGAFAIASHSIVIDEPPVSSFDVSSPAVAGQQVTLTSTSSDPDGPVAGGSRDLKGAGTVGRARSAGAAVPVAS